MGSNPIPPTRVIMNNDNIEKIVIRNGSKIVWATLANHDDTKVLKQHAFKSTKRGDIIIGKYDGNISLCGKIGAHDGLRFLPIEKIENENLSESKACKKCLQSYITLLSLFSNTPLTLTPNK